MLIANLLPSPLLFRLKKSYYVRAVQSFWEADTEPMKYLVKAGDFVLDIGANVGWYTRILAALVGEQGKVYSIEPIPETFKLLSAVIQKLCFKNVHPINCAVSEKDGCAFMEVPLYDHGAPNFYQSRIVGNERATHPVRQYKVDVRSIDSLFLELSQSITFIKCDVEGHELSVIKGAFHFFLKSKPAWLIEISGNPDDDSGSSKDVFKHLRDQNYTPYWFDGRRLKKHSPGDKAINYFFLQRSHLGQLGPMGVHLERDD